MLERVSVDTTVQPKAIAHPTDSRLYLKALLALVRQAKRHGMTLRQTPTRLHAAPRHRSRVTPMPARRAA
jgi:transposase, IS5 family